METFRLFRLIALGALGLGAGLLLSRPFVVQDPSGPGQLDNPAAHAREPIRLIAANDRVTVADFGFKDEQGKTHRLSELVGQRPILIHFWATWCVPCLPELPELDGVAARDGQRLTLLPLSLDRDALTVARTFLDGKHLAALAVFAPETDAPLPQALPTSILVDKSGKVAWTTAGAHPWGGADLDAALKALD